MAAPTNHWKLGLFVVVGFVLTLTTVAILGARSLRKEVGRYVSYFDESVQGLEVGSPIKFRGVTIGTVSIIDVAVDHRHVEVTLDLGIAELTRLGLDKPMVGETQSSPKKLTMTTDLRLQLASAGVTGVKFLQLDFFVVADNPAPDLPFTVPPNYIPSTPSLFKNLEDSVVRTVNRLPELAEQLSGILIKVDRIVGEVGEQKVPTQIAAMLDNTNRLIRAAHGKVEAVEAGKLSKKAEGVMTGLDETTARLNALLSHIDGEKGLLGSVVRASEAIGDTARNADGVGTGLEETLRSVQEAAKSIHKLADALEKDPDMLLKGHAERK